MRPPPCWPTLQPSLPRSEQRRTRTRRLNQTSWSLPVINYFNSTEENIACDMLKWENQIQCLSVLLKTYSCQAIRLCLGWDQVIGWRPGNSDPPQHYRHYTRTVSVLYITPHTSQPKAAPSRQITLQTCDRPLVMKSRIKKFIWWLRW